MRERIGDYVRRRSSPPPPRKSDISDLVRSDCCSDSSRSGGFQREYDDSASYEVERRRYEGLRKREHEQQIYDEYRRKLYSLQRDTFSGEVYPDRSESDARRFVGSEQTEQRLPHGFGNSLRQEEELSRSHEPEQSSIVSNFVRPTTKQCWRDESELSRSISSHDYSSSVSPVTNALRNDVDRLGSSGSRNYSDSERLRMQPNRTSEHERNEVVRLAMKCEQSGKQWNEDGRARDCYIPALCKSYVGSSSSEIQHDHRRQVRLNPSSGIGGNDLDRIHRVDERNVGCLGRVQHARDIDRHVDRNSLRGFQEDEKAKSLRTFSHSQGCNGCCCVISTVAKWGQGTDNASLENYRRGCSSSHPDLAVKWGQGTDSASLESYRRGCSSSHPDLGVTEFSRDSRRTHMGIDMDPYMHMRGPLLKSNLTDSVINEVDGGGTGVGIRISERISEQYDSFKEHIPFVEFGSSMHDDRSDEAHHYRRIHSDVGNDGYLDNQLRKDHQVSLYSTIDPDVDGSDTNMIDRDERALQLRRVCFNNKGKEAYVDDENLLLQRNCDFESCERMYHHVNGPDAMVDRDDISLQFRRRRLNPGNEVYLNNEDHQLQKDYEFDSYGSGLSTLMVNQGEESPQLRRLGAQVYLDGESMRLENPNQVHLRSRRGQLKGRQEVYVNDETLHTRDKDGYAESGRIWDHEIGYDYIDECYAVERTTSTEHLRSLVDERRFGNKGKEEDYEKPIFWNDKVGYETNVGNEDQNKVTRRIPVKERLGGRVKDRVFDVKKRLGSIKRGCPPWAKNSTPYRKKEFPKTYRSQWGNSSKR